MAEDNEVNLALLVVARMGQEAVDLPQSDKPELVLMGIQMPCNERGRSYATNSSAI